MEKTCCHLYKQNVMWLFGEKATWSTQDPNFKSAEMPHGMSCVGFCVGFCCCTLRQSSCHICRVTGISAFKFRNGNLPHSVLRMRDKTLCSRGGWADKQEFRTRWQGTGYFIRKRLCLHSEHMYTYPFALKRGTDWGGWLDDMGKGKDDEGFGWKAIHLCC